MERTLTRRDLIKASAAAGAGLMLGPGPRILSAKSPNEKLNIACIGIGGRGGANVGGLGKENIVALCDVDDKRGGKQYKRFPRARKFYDFRKMFDAMANQIDAVAVSTPDHTHFHPVIWSLQRGKHVYCEKPMAHNVWEVRRMTELARKKKLATQLGVQRHTIENVHRVVELVRGGAIGEVKEVHSWVGGSRGMPADPKEFPPVPDTLKWDLWLGPAADRKYSPAYCPYNWRFWWDFGTGETGNWGCHILDIPFWALGLTYPTRVDGSGPEVHAAKTPKSLTTKLQFPAVGSRGPVTLHWSHGGSPILKAKGLSGKGANNVFVGTEGILVCGFGSRRLYPQEKFKDFKAPPKTITDSPGFHTEWIQAVKGGEAATCNFDYTGPMAETVLLGNVAYRAGGFDWDWENLKAAGNDKAQALIREQYRKGWELEV
jgi:predicted dehydrogenase